MIAVDPILDFLSICIWTASIENEQAVSVVLVSESSAGKSTILKQLQCPTTIFLTDMTTRDISKVMEDKEKRIILLSDMQAMFSHKSTVVGTTSQALRNLLEEGIYNDPFSGNRINRRFGMISAIPPAEFSRINRVFCSGGLDTRFLVFEYEYKKETITQIHDYVEKGEPHAKKEKRISLPENGEVRVVLLPPAIAKRCRDLAALLKRDGIGIRVHHQIRALVMASAAQQRRKKASIKDFKRVARFADFLDPNRMTRVTL